MLKKFFWNLYDHLGTCVVLNLLWFLASLPWFLAIWSAGRLLVSSFGAVGFVTALAAGFAAIWLNPATLTAMFCATRWVRYQRVERADVWRFFRSQLVPGIALPIAAALVFVILGANAAFYLRASWMPRFVGLLLAGVMLWAQIAFLLVAFWFGLNRAAGDDGARFREVVRDSIVLTFRYPARSAGLFVSTFVMGAAMALTQVGLVLIAMSLAAVFAATGRRELLRAMRRGEGEGNPDTPEEPRTFRDLFTPWEANR